MRIALYARVSTVKQAEKDLSVRNLRVVYREVD